MKPSASCPCGKNHRADKHDIVMDAIERERQAYLRTARTPCQMCGGDHRTYHCCPTCNVEGHKCMLCGDSIGHEEVSACYIIFDLEEADPQGWEIDRDE